jgi:hypothetical protein
MTWAQRLKRVFNIHVTTWSHCGGAVKIIASIEDPRVIKKILDHLYVKSKACDLASPDARCQMPGPRHKQSFFNNREIKLIAAQGRRPVGYPVGSVNESSNLDRKCL